MFRDISHYLGFISKPHGVKGDIILSIENGNPENFIELELVFLEIEGKLVPFFIEKVQPIHGSQLLIKLEDVNNEEQASSLKGTVVYYHNTTETGHDTPNYDTLKGFVVKDEKNHLIGVINEITDYSGNLLVEVYNKNSGELMLPINDNLIMDINFEERYLVLEIPDGLLDINQ